MKNFKTFYFSEAKSYKSSLGDLNLQEIADEYVTAAGPEEDPTKEQMVAIIKDLEKLPDPLTIYRIVGVDSEEDLDTEKIGEHWSISKEAVEHFLGDGYDGSGDRTMILTAKIEKKYVNWITTVAHRLEHPMEEEINVNEKYQSKIKILSKEISKELEESVRRKKKRRGTWKSDKAHPRDIIGVTDNYNEPTGWMFPSGTEDAVNG
jgi:hypothetical protein